MDLHGLERYYSELYSFFIEIIWWQNYHLKFLYDLYFVALKHQFQKYKHCIDKFP